MHTPPSVHQVLSDIPEEFVERYEHLLGAPVLSKTEATQRMGAHLSGIRHIAAVVPHVNAQVAERIADVLLELLDRHPDTSAVSAAIRYFLEEDEDDEITGVLGFDDDLAVVSALCRAAEDGLLLQRLSS